MSELEVLINKTESGSQKLHSFITKAIIALNIKDEETLHREISNAFLFGNKIQLYSTIGISRSNIQKLCAIAFQNNIELDYAKILIQEYDLLYPRDILINENWPWRLKVKVFDSFDVQIENEGIVVKGKKQTKAIELLQIITAMGGADIENWYVAEMLWPDSEGDAAHHAFETTLHRLRKQVGKEAIMVNNNKISLSRELCWTDVWQFEAYINQIKEVIALKGDSREIDTYMKGLNAMYSGNLLNGYNSVWIISLREKYKEKYTKLIGEVVTYFQDNAAHEPALELLEHALEIETTSEDLYLQTMLCYEALGKRSKAMDVFRKCENNLIQKHNAQLSSQIKQLASSLQ